MGEKGNLLDTGEEIFASLAEQGPQFWLNYKQYMESRCRSAEAARCRPISTTGCAGFMLRRSQRT
jgi:hypothetical protein